MMLIEDPRFSFDTIESDKKKKSVSKRNLPSFSGIAHTQIFSSWRKSLIDGDYETCCHWSIEIALSGWTPQLWENINLICAKHIHSQNPKIILFLQKMRQDFPYLTDESPDAVNTFRKDPQLREALALAIGVVCYSPKGIVYPPPSLKMNEYEVQQALDKLRNGVISPEIKPICLECDSHIISVLISACFAHILNTDLNNALRTFGWLLFLEKDKKIQSQIETSHYSFRFFWNRWNNENIEIPSNCNKDWVFMFWDACYAIIPHLPSVQSQSHIKMYTQILDAWKEFYFSHFSKKNKNSRTIVLIHICILFSQKTYHDIPCIHNNKIIQKACSNIDVMYHEIMSRRQI